MLSHCKVIGEVNGAINGNYLFCFIVWPVSTKYIKCH